MPGREGGNVCASGEGRGAEPLCSSEFLRVLPSGDRAALVEFEERIDPGVNLRVRSLASVLETAKIPGVQEILPAYRTLMVLYDPLVIAWQALAGKIREALPRAARVELPPGRLFRLPTVYGGAHGPDLPLVAEAAGLGEEGVVRIFAETRFLVYFIGFICGLAYLGGLPDHLRVPRLATPRTLVPGGSVGLAGGQANALTTDQPSGFNYIGRTFVSLYNPKVFPPAPFAPGDTIQFVSVAEEAALAAGGREAADFT